MLLYFMDYLTNCLGFQLSVHMVTHEFNGFKYYSRITGCEQRVHKIMFYTNIITINKIIIVYATTLCIISSTYGLTRMFGIWWPQ